MKLIQAYLQFIPGGRSKLAIVILLNVVGALFQGASVGLLLPALQIVENQSGLRQSGFVWKALGFVFNALHLPINLSTLLLGVLAMIVAGQGLLYIQRHMSVGMSADLVVSLRRDAFAAIMRADMTFHHAVRRGTIVSGLVEDALRTGTMLESMLELVSHTILVVFYASLLFMISWEASVVGLVTVALASLIVYARIRAARRIGEQTVRATREMFGFIGERVSAVKLMKLRNAVESDTRHFWEVSRKLVNLRCRQTREGAQIRFFMEPALAAGGVAATYVGFTFFHMSLAQLAILMYVLIRIVPEAYSWNQARHTVAGLVGHFHNVMDLIDRAKKGATLASGSRLFSGLRHAIVFKDVNFAYNSSAPVLHNLGLTMEAGKITAIVGRSGIGKSTLLDLVARLIDPSGGQVLFDGVDVREFDLVSLRRQIGIVSQEIVIFNDTVLENICYGCPEASEEEIVQAAMKANAHEFIRALPHGYRTVIGPRGMTLSGGERQRLELARALLRNPPILLLDEVTSGLDAESERLIQESVLDVAHGRTVVIVTHRLSMVRKAHKVVVLDEGRVLEEGTPEELLENDGLFRRYHDLQFVGTESSR